MSDTPAQSSFSRFGHPVIRLPFSFLSSSLIGFLSSLCFSSLLSHCSLCLRLFLSFSCVLPLTSSYPLATCIRDRTRNQWQFHVLPVTESVLSYPLPPHTHTHTKPPLPVFQFMLLSEVQPEGMFSDSCLDNRSNFDSSVEITVTELADCRNTPNKNRHKHAEYLYHWLVQVESQYQPCSGHFMVNVLQNHLYKL